MPTEFEPRIYADINTLTESRKPRDRFLPVLLNNKQCFLPMTKVGPPGHEEWIAYYDPRFSDLCIHGAYEIAMRLNELKTDVIVTPSSGKSTLLMQYVQFLMQEKYQKPVDLIVLKKGPPDEMEEEVKFSVFSKIYQPITSGNKDRVMVVSGDNFKKLSAHLRENHSLAFVDDVYSRGGTAEAGLNLIDQVKQRIGLSVNAFNPTPLVTVMRECEIDPTGQLNMPDVPGLWTAIVTPVYQDAHYLSVTGLNLN